jgi:glucosamine-6-phosphate deaminase
MRVSIFPDRLSLAGAAARDAAALIRAAIAARGDARIVAATGTSQIAFLDRLTRETDLDWSRVEVFHLDEYVGLPEDHPASFRKYLRERLIQPAGIERFHLIDGLCDPDEVCATLGRQVRVELPGGAPGAPDGVLTGEAVDVDENGRLVVRAADGDHALSAGDVVHIR